MVLLEHIQHGPLFVRNGGMDTIYSFILFFEYKCESLLFNISNKSIDICFGMLILHSKKYIEKVGSDKKKKINVKFIISHTNHGNFLSIYFSRSRHFLYFVFSKTIFFHILCCFVGKTTLISFCVLSPKLPMPPCYK